MEARRGGWGFCMHVCASSSSFKNLSLSFVCMGFFIGLGVVTVRPDFAIGILVSWLVRCLLLFGRISASPCHPSNRDGKKFSVSIVTLMILLPYNIPICISDTTTAICSLIQSPRGPVPHVALDFRGQGRDAPTRWINRGISRCTRLANHTRSRIRDVCSNC